MTGSASLPREKPWAERLTSAKAATTCSQNRWLSSTTTMRGSGMAKDATTTDVREQTRSAHRVRPPRREPDLATTTQQTERSRQHHQSARRGGRMTGEVAASGHRTAIIRRRRRHVRLCHRHINRRCAHVWRSGHHLRARVVQRSRRWSRRRTSQRVIRQHVLNEPQRAVLTVASR